jgi:hypothetical protein
MPYMTRSTTWLMPVASSDAIEYLVKIRRTPRAFSSGTEDALRKD